MSSLVRSLFNKSFKHKRLYEDWTNLQEPVEEGVTFICKWLGVTVVDEARSESSISQAIRRIIQLAKSSRNKPQKVGIHVSANGIVLLNTIRPNRVLRKLSIYNISFCCTDAKYEHVFAYVVTVDRICECHAFLCRSSKMAQNVAISIAHAFNIAYDSWKSEKNSKSDKEKEKNQNNEHCDIKMDQRIDVTVDDSSSISSGSSELHSLSLTDDEMKSDNDIRIDSKNINERAVRTDRYLTARKNWASFDDSVGIQGEFCRLTNYKSAKKENCTSAWTNLPTQNNVPGTSRNTQVTSINTDCAMMSPQKEDSINRNIINGLTLPLKNNKYYAAESLDNFAFLQSCISPMSLQDSHTGPTFNWTVFTDS